MKELIDDTKKFNEIYKKLFKEYFDKPLKQNGFYKKGSINFFRLNKLGILENLNFQKYYDRMTVNYSVVPIYCGVLKISGVLGGRLGYYFNGKDYWWSLKDEETMKKSMIEMLEIIQTKQCEWFKKMEKEDKIIDLVSNSYTTVIYRSLAQATTMAKFKKYNEIRKYIIEIKEKYKTYGKEEIEREWLQDIIKETLFLEEKLKEGQQAVDEYIIEREKQSLRELGLEKLIKE